MNRIDELIKLQLDPIFDRYVTNEDTIDLYDEISMNLKEAVIEHMEQGASEDEAVQVSFQQFGDVAAVLADISTPQSTASESSNHTTNESATQEFTQSSEDSSKETYSGTVEGDAQSSQNTDSFTFNFNTDTFNAELFKEAFTVVRDSVGEALNIVHDEVKGAFHEVCDAVEDAGESFEEAKAGNPFSDFVNTYTSFGMLKDMKLVNEILVPVADLQHICVIYHSDTVYVEDSNEDQVRLREFMTIDDPSLYAQYAVKNGELSIVAGKRPILMGGLRTRIELYIPKSFSQKLSLQVSSGSLKIQNLPKLSDLTIMSKSGSQKLNDVNANILHVTATSGSIKMEDCTYHSVVIGVNSGSVRMDRVHTEEIIGKTTSGSIKAYGATFANSATLVSNSGSIKMEDCKSYTLEILTSSGSVKVDTDKTKGTFISSSGSVNVKTKELIGDVNLKSTSGSSKLYLHSEQDFRFDLRNGSGSAKVKAERREYTKKNSHHKAGFVGSNQGPLVTGESTSGSVSVNIM